ncbi:MAG: universal stress protein [Chloroflexota bacterium]
MFKQVIVPLDGSELAEQALPYAEHLAAATGATLHLVRVVEPPSAVRAHGLGAPVNVYENVVAAQRGEATAYLDGIRSRLESEGITTIVATLDGYAAAALLDYAREESVDLVVMTTRGRTGLTRWAVGSVADRVAHGGTVAVLLVPAGPGH